MPSVRLASNGGAAIIVDGVAYYLKTGQPTLGIVNAVADVANIPAKTWGLDDNNVAPPTGANHLTWTACECAVAGYVVGNQAAVTASGIGTLDLLFTAPSQGVARCAHSNLSYDYPSNYYVRRAGTGSDILYGIGQNNVVGWGGPSVWPNLQSSGYCIMLNTGDIVKVESVGGTSQYLWFLPYTY